MSIETTARKLNWKSWSLSRHGRQLVAPAGTPSLLPADNVQYGFVARAHELSFQLFADSARDLAIRLRDDVWATPVFETLIHREALLGRSKKLSATASQNLLIAAGLLKWHEQTCRAQADRSEPLYFHGLMTGIIASRINRHWDLGFQGEEFLAGLLHDVGRLLLLLTIPDQYASFELPGQPDSADRLREEHASLGIDHCEVGVWFLEKTDLPQPIHTAVRFHHHPFGAPDHLRLVCLTTIADQIAERIQPRLFLPNSSHPDRPFDAVMTDCLQLLGIDPICKAEWEEWEHAVLGLLQDLAIARATTLD